MFYGLQHKTWEETKEKLDGLEAPKDEIGWFTEANFDKKTKLVVLTDEGLEFSARLSGSP